MNLLELKQAVDNAITMAGEYGQEPSDITVSLQIERDNQDPLWADQGIELHYDNDVMASGCVLLGFAY